MKKISREMLSHVIDGLDSDDELVREIATGVMLFSLAAAANDATRHAYFDAWRSWVLRLDHHSCDAECWSSMVTLMIALARQEWREWSAYHWREIGLALSAWLSHPRITRKQYEYIDDNLVDFGVHVTPW